MKRYATEIADFSKDLLRFKLLFNWPGMLGRFEREFPRVWGAEEVEGLTAGQMWGKTRSIRYMGETFSALPVLQLLNMGNGIGVGVGLQRYRFRGAEKEVPLFVRVAELLHTGLTQHVSKSSAQAATNAGNIRGEDSDEDCDALVLDDMKRVQASLMDFLRLINQSLANSRKINLMPLKNP
jgi:hypothetical protein